MIKKIAYTLVWLIGCSLVVYAFEELGATLKQLAKESEGRA